MLTAITRVKGESKNVLTGVTKMKQSKQEQEVLNFAQTARFLGVTRPTLRSYVQKNAIPYRRVMRRYFFYRAKLIEWLSGDYANAADAER